MYYFSCLCLIGLPFLSGFFSKDFIIEKIIESSIEILFVMLLLIFLSIRIYYSVKLLKLTSYLFSYSIIEKRWVGLGRVVTIRVVIILIINVYIRLVFSVRLELLSFKLSIYILIILFFFLRVLTNLNLKFGAYDKIRNFIEVWKIDYYVLDKFIYWNMFSFLQLVRLTNNLKLFLLINWWICILFIVLF